MIDRRRLTPGQIVTYKASKYVIIMTPETFKMRLPSGWAPAYLYTDIATGHGYSREQSDFESKFIAHMDPPVPVAEVRESSFGEWLDASRPGGL